LTRSVVQAGVGTVASFAVGLALAAHAMRPQPAPCDIFCHARLATRAEAAGNLGEYQRHVRLIANAAPSHPGVVFALARAFMHGGSPDSALTALDRMAHMGDARDPNADSLFNTVRRSPRYVAARNRLLANRLPLLDGKVAFEIDDPDFTPEAIAYDSAGSRFLAGSLSKRLIAAVAPNGMTTPFIAPRSDILRVVGMHIDTPRRRLWFATWGPAATGGSDTTETPSLTRLFLAELPSGRIVKSWVPDGGRAGHALNDFVVMSDGGLILTDTEQGALYRLRSPDDTLELFIQPDANRLSTANGIAITPDQRTLYVAFVEGLVRVDVATKAIVPIPAPDTVSTAAIDGLYWYRGDLLAVQAIPTLARVVRYRLSGTGDRIVSASVLERGQPLINEPTTGTLVGSRFYYIANSQYGRLDERGALEPRTGPATRTVVRVIELR
jgi:hypothetical protein